ncbi:glycosyl hydrolase [Helicosporidium sp. ATCC 50920]|nr:glycosyl hydrolase [Helicosporidium sp. ATCC 50920]|eukprot:KDD75361.1 glycosyl hydrolase [Helicosporidium sp. ATCC 50920]
MMGALACEVGTTQKECERQGCCWSPSKFEDFVPVDLPWCFQKNNGSVEYALRGAQSTDTSVHGVLELQHADFLPALGEDAPALDASLVLVAPTIARLTLLPRGGKPRWRVPTALLNSPFLHSLKGAELPPDGARPSDAAPTEWVRLGPPAPSSPPDGGPALLVEYRAEPFALRVLAPSDGPTPRELFSTDAKRLAARDQYLEWLARVPANATLFGAGERGSHTMRLRRNGAPRPIWARDIGPTLLEQNMYGAHPFVLALEPEGLAWGVFLLNSNAMDVVPSADALAFRAVGGVLDFFFFLGPEPQDVMEQYTRVVGRPAMVPYWALGWHQSKYGYASVGEMREVVANYSAVGLPLETLWADIDHMDKWKDFTFDPVNFPMQGMQDLVRGLHANQQRFVPIVDPGIKVEQGYQPYEVGLAQELFVKGVDNKNPYLGWVWPGPCHFPDFAHPPTQQYFTDALAEHHKNLDFDGIWIDMDEASNFCTGDVCVPRSSPANALPMRPLSRLTKEPQWVCHLECSEATDLSPEQRALRHPPYDVSNGLARAPLGEKVISVLARRVDGSWEYDAHNLYGLAEVRVTHAALERVRGRRPFVLSRASWAGTGAYAAHWTGDNEATWEQLRMSIPGMLNIGLFGMPMAGVDICGFQKNTTMELCSRWTSLGAFYPFSRSHSDLHSTRQARMAVSSGL